MKQASLKMVSGEGIATVTEKDYRHLDKCSIFARVDISDLRIILWRLPKLLYPSLLHVDIRREFEGFL